MPITGNFPDNHREIDDIKARIDIVDLISRYVELKPAGKNFKGKCPFHTEKTPSFMVSPDLQIYKCFGCGESGDIFTFLMKHEHLEFPEVLEVLAKQAGITLQKKNRPINKSIAILEMINKLAADFFHSQLLQPVGRVALQYLEGRNLKAEAIEKFSLGYAPGGNSLYSYIMSKAKFTREQLLQSGLFIEKAPTQSKGPLTIRDKFNKRVIFPIKTVRGKIIAFNGRILPGNDYGPKYLHSPETPLFHKKENVFGLYEAKRDIRAENLCILCEGATDVITCNLKGIRNIVAPLGTALTKEQVQLLRHYTENVLLLFDSDEAGQKAVERGFMLCSQEEFNVFANSTGKYKDLDEMAQKDFEAVKKLVETKEDAFTYLLGRKLKNRDLGKLQDYKFILSYIGILLQSVKKEDTLKFYTEKATKLTGITEDIIKASIKAPVTTQSARFQNTPTDLNLVSSPKETEHIVQKRGALDLETYLLALIASLPAQKHEECLNIDTSFFYNETVTKAISLIKKKVATEKGSKKDTPLVKVLHQDKELSTYIEELLLKRDILLNLEKVTDYEKEVNVVYKRIQHDFYRHSLASLRKELAIEEEKEDPNREKIGELSAKIIDISKML